MYSGNNSHVVNGSNGHPGHFNNRNPTSRRPLFYDHCKMSGHTIHKCYKIHGHPPSHRLYQSKRVVAFVPEEQDGMSWIEDLHGLTSYEKQYGPAISLATLNVEQYQ